MNATVAELRQARVQGFFSWALFRSSFELVGVLIKEAKTAAGGLMQDAASWNMGQTAMLLRGLERQGRAVPTGFAACHGTGSWREAAATRRGIARFGF